MSDTKPVLVAVDDGFRQIKLLSSEDHRFTQLSVVGPGFTLGGSVASGAADAGFGAYRTDGRDFTVDPDISNKEGTRYDGYALSDLNRVLVYHAMYSAGLGGRDVILATGLPYARYYSGDALLDRKMENLAIPVESMTGAPMPKVVQQHVLPQAVMAYMDYAYDDFLMDFRAGVKSDMPVVVIDVGGGTTDIATVLPNGHAPKVDHLKSGTIKVGVLDTLKELTARLERRFNFTGVRESLLERCIRTRRVYLRGAEHDISDDIDAAVDVAVQPMLRELQRLVGGAASETPLLVGGGAALVADALRKAYPHLVVAEDPEFANARGMLKTLQRSYA